jgi:transglutaminase-like putative cysteine protease
VSLSLGIGGYQPRTPASVLETQYGDCKDKATLFVALARRMGVNAFPVLLSSGGGWTRRSPPSTSSTT